MVMSARESQDIKTVLTLLVICVKKPDKDDWEKLKRVLKYLKGTRELKPTLSVSDI